MSGTFNRVPSEKALELAWPGKGKQLREALWILRAGRSKTWSHQMDAMEECAEILGEVGVETIASNDSILRPSVVLSYVNVGDPYRSTLIWHGRSDVVTIGCWGGTIEALERKGIHFD